MILPAGLPAGLIAACAVLLLACEAPRETDAGHRGGSGRGSPVGASGDSPAHRPATASRDRSAPEIRRTFSIPFTPRRIALTREYARLHYSRYYEATTGSPEMPGLRIDPKVVVVHYTAGLTLQGAFKTFEPETLGGRPYLQASGAVNVSVQFIVDRDGTIYQTMPEDTFCRHCIGLNHCSIGFENIGSADIGEGALRGERDPDRRRLTLAQLEANVRLIRHLKRKYPGLEVLIGHMEYRQLERPDHPGHRWFQENDPGYRTAKSDPGPRFMAALRSRLADLLTRDSGGHAFR